MWSGEFMFFRLDRIDAVTGDKGSGKLLFIQTDHRSAEEIRRAEDLSVLFALTRVLNPRAGGPPDDVEVQYVCVEPPPDFLHRAVVAAGGRLHLTGQKRLPYEGVLGSPEELADGALRRVAHRAIRERGATLSEEFLVALQREHAQAPGRQEDEPGYWCRTIELGAVTGELLRARFGGRWSEIQRKGTIPFGFRIGPDDGSSPVFNAMNKAERFLAWGERESLVQLLRMAEDHGLRGTGTRPVVLTLRAPKWSGHDSTVCQPLSSLRDATSPAAWIAYGEELPHSFALFTRDGTIERDIGVLHRQALENLKGVSVELQEEEVDGLRVIAAAGSYFAAEKVLDEDFMRSMHERLGSPLLMVGIPRRGLLLIAKATETREPLGRFLRLCEAEHGNGVSEPISPLPLILREGKIAWQAGEGRPKQPPSAEPRKGFFRRLLSWLKR